MTRGQTHVPKQRCSREQPHSWADNPKEAKEDFPYPELSIVPSQIYHQQKQSVEAEEAEEAAEAEEVEVEEEEGREIRDLIVLYQFRDMTHQKRKQVPEHPPQL